MAKRLLSWLIVVVALLAVSAVILLGALINEKTTSSRKPEPMKEKRPVKRLTDEAYIESKSSKTLLVRAEVEGDKLTVIAGDKDFFIVRVRFWGETGCKDERCPAVVYLEVPLLKGGRITLRHPFAGMINTDIKYSTRQLVLGEEYIYIDEDKSILLIPEY